MARGKFGPSPNLYENCFNSVADSLLYLFLNTNVRTSLSVLTVTISCLFLSMALQPFGP
jgi:hypothetical protein